MAEAETLKDEKEKKIKEETKEEVEAAAEEEEEEEILFLPENSLHSPRIISHSDPSSQTSPSETLTFPSAIQSKENAHDSFSELLAGAMVTPTKNSSVKQGSSMDVLPSLSAALDPAGFKGQFGMSHQEALATVTAQAAQAQARMQRQAGYPCSSSETSPASLAQSMSSAMSATPVKQELPLVSQESSVCTPEVDQRNSSDPKTDPANLVVVTPASDGYSWRKYGQKQVKSNESSRSYYKCTDGSCYAKKKIESCDHSGHVIEIIYKDQHNHDPPLKIRCTKASGCVSSAGPIVCAGPDSGSETVERPVIKLNSPAQPIYTSPLQKLPILRARDRDASIKLEEGHGDEPQPKRRMKYKSVVCSAPQIKTLKAPKVVVQAAGDVGNSDDGYRWRKYGQKMVKGNPHPRSYYRCTSAGCTVRKHVERAADDSAGTIITYEGEHNHDMPVPRKRHAPPRAALLIAAAAGMDTAEIQTSEALPSKSPSTPLSMEKDGELTGEKALELEDEKALELEGERALELGSEKALELGDEKAIELGDEKALELGSEKALELGGEKALELGGEKALELGGEKALESARTLLSMGFELKPC